MKITAFVDKKITRKQFLLLGLTSLFGIKSLVYFFNSKNIATSELEIPKTTAGYGHRPYGK